MHKEKQKGENKNRDGWKAWVGGLLEKQGKQYQKLSMLFTETIRPTPRQMDFCFPTCEEYTDCMWFS